MDDRFTSRKFSFYRLFLATALCFCTVSTLANTDGDWTFTYSGSTATITGYSGSDTVVTVPSTVTRTEEYQEKDDEGKWHTRHRTYNYTVTSIGNSVFKNNTSLTSVAMPSSILSIGEQLFFGCSSVQSININGNIKTIPYCCFEGCAALSEFSIPDSVTSIGEYAFSGCSSWAKELSFQNVRFIDNLAFKNCQSIKSLEIGNQLVSLGYAAFQGCSSMENARINGTNLSIPSAAFAGCSNLENVSFGDGIVSIASGNYNNTTTSTFQGCNKLRTLSFGMGLTQLSHTALAQLPALEELIIPYVEKIGSEAIYGCAKLTTCVLNPNIVEIGDNAFEDCRNINFGRTAFSHLKHIGERAFSRCQKLELFDFPETLHYIGGRAFQHCVRFKSVSLGPSVTTLGGYAFYGCDRITNVVVDCPVTLPNCLFGNCSNLVSVTIGDNVQDLGSSGPSWSDHPFWHCPKIKTFHIGKGITSIPYRYFYDHDGVFPANQTIEEIDLPESIETVGSWAFGYCKNANFGSLSLPKIKRIGDYAFTECDGLTSIILPSSLSSLDISTFQYCRNLTTVHIPSSLSTIPNKCFCFCSRLETVKIPKSIKQINTLAFWNCSTLTGVWFEGIPPTTGGKAFSAVASGARGYYPRSLASAWLPQIGSDGKWNGLIMHELSQPVLRVKSANPAEGSITLAWDDGTDGQCVSSYSIYRSANDTFTEEDRVATGITETEWTDTGYWNAEPVLSPLNYWVVAESDYFDLPESNAVETRRRHCLSVGYNSYTTGDKGLVQARNDAILFRSLCINGANVLAGNAGLLSNATTASVRAAMNSLHSKAIPGDTVLFYIATHGGDYDEEGDIQSHLVTYDGKYNVRSLLEDANRFNPGVAFVGIIMACHSQSLTGTPNGDDTAFASKIDRWLARCGFAECRGNIAWITSCGANENSYASTTYSLFGQIFLNDGWQMRYADAALVGCSYDGGNRDGSISLLEIARYAKEFCRGESEDKPSTVNWENEGLLSRIIVQMGEPPNTIALDEVNEVFATQNASNDKIQLDWGEAGGATGYWVYRHPEGDVSKRKCISYIQSGLRFVDSGLVLNRNYAYTIRSVSRSGIGNESAVVVGRTGLPAFLNFLENFGKLSGDAIPPESYEALKNSIGVNGVNLESSFIAGLDPNDEASRFTSLISIGPDGKPIVSWQPDLNEDGTKAERVYRVLGAKALNGEVQWDDVTDLQDYGAEQGYRFFKVDVELP